MLNHGLLLVEENLRMIVSPFITQALRVRIRHQPSFPSRTTKTTHISCRPISTQRAKPIVGNLYTNRNKESLIDSRVINHRSELGLSKKHVFQRETRKWSEPYYADHPSTRSGLGKPTSLRKSSGTDACPVGKIGT